MSPHSVSDAPDSPHRAHMQRALDLARLQNGRTGKNPSVGCVIVSQAGHVLSEAATGDTGHPHAEQLALKDLTRAQTQGATAYVTLEPCHTRSNAEPACSTRLIDAGIAAVYIATRDRHPQGDGGAQRLAASGVRLEWGLLKAEADALYADFFRSVPK